MRLAELDGRRGICRGRIAIVNAKQQDEDNLTDEHEAKEEREASHRIVAAPLESPMIDLIDRLRPPHRRRVTTKSAATSGSSPNRSLKRKAHIGAEHHEGRMGDIGDVEQAERNGRAGGHASIESAEQNPGDDGVCEEIEGEHGRCRPVGSPRRAMMPGRGDRVTGAPSRTA